MGLLTIKVVNLPCTSFSDMTYNLCTPYYCFDIVASFHMPIKFKVSRHLVKPSQQKRTYPPIHEDFLDETSVPFAVINSHEYNTLMQFEN